MISVEPQIDPTGKGGAHLVAKRNPQRNIMISQNGFENPKQEEIHEI